MRQPQTQIMNTLSANRSMTRLEWATLSLVWGGSCFFVALARNRIAAFQRDRNYLAHVDAFLWNA